MKFGERSYLGWMWSGNIVVSLNWTRETLSLAAAQRLTRWSFWWACMRGCMQGRGREVHSRKDGSIGGKGICTRIPKGDTWGLKWQKFFLYLWSLGFWKAKLLGELSGTKGIYVIWGSENSASESPSAELICYSSATVWKHLHHDSHWCPATPKIQLWTPISCPFFINCPWKEGPVEPNPLSDASGKARVVQ